MKRRDDVSDNVAASDLLADYVVTRAPTMSARTGLPPVAMPEDPHADDETIRPVQERRHERRVTAVRRVIASHPGSDRDVMGQTDNISTGGMCLVMPEPPPAIHQDVVVTDNEASASVWIQVTSHRLVPTGGYVWHVKVTAADSEWEDLIARAGAPAATTRRKNRKRRAAAS